MLGYHLAFWIAAGLVVAAIVVPYGLAAHAPGCRHFRARAAARRRGPGDVRSRMTRTHRTQG